MGTGTILSETGAGLYTIEVDTGSALIDAKIASFTAQIAAAEAQTATLQTASLTASNAFRDAGYALDAAIDAYNSATSGGGDGSNQLSSIKEKTSAMVAAQIAREKADRELNKNTASISSITASIEYYQGFDLTEQKQAWCVDYTVAATGQVATIEVPGEPAAVVLAPDCPAPVDATDGIVTARPAHDPNQLYLNLAILPGWQKYSPTYRVGVITFISSVDDTCTVQLDAAVSSAQSLDINQTEYLYDVPIVYMTCNSSAFRLLDRVIVQFLAQDWEQPRVIGFESNPRRCALGIAREGWYCPLTGAYNESWGFCLDGQNGQDLLDEIRAIEIPSDTSNLIVEVRPDGGSWSTWPCTATTQLDEIGGYAGDEAVQWIFENNNFILAIADTSGDFYPWGAGLITRNYEISYALTEPATIQWRTKWDGAWPEDIYEIKVSNVFTGQIYWHASLRQSDDGVYNVASVDLIEDPDKIVCTNKTEFDLNIITDYNFPA